MTLGQLLLGISFLLSTFGLFAPIVAIAQKKDYLKYVYVTAYIVAGLMTFATGLLSIYILNSNFSFAYVADYSSRALGWLYKLSAVYAGQAGSLLFWGWLISVFTAIVAFVNRDDESEFMSYVMSVLFSIIWMFLFLITVASWFQEYGVPAANFFNYFFLMAILLTIMWTAFFSFQKREREETYAWVIYGGLALGSIFFLLRMGILNTTYVGTNPFELLKQIPQDGQGLNPLLQNYGMILHPPTLFLGFAGFSVPFAYAMAALFTNQLDNYWIKKSRSWIIFSWLLLGIGIIIGGQWAYMELGWGGYWAWDPVENASLMPWLTGTALVHSALAQRRKSILKIWTMFLVSLTFILSIYGTYLTRSGVVGSVHSFGESPLGNLILTFVAVSFFGSIALIFCRMKNLKSDKQVDNILSKEFMLMLTNFLLAFAALVVFYGTDYALIAGILQKIGTKLGIALPLALTGKQAVGKGFYEPLIGSLSVILFMVMAFCPLIPWKKLSSLKNLLVPFVTGMGAIVALALVVKFKFPSLTRGAIIGVPVGIGLLILMAYVSVQQIYKSVKGETVHRWVFSLLSFTFVFPVIYAIVLDIFFKEKLRVNWDRVGAFVVHLGMALAFIGIIVSSVFATSKTATLSVGESAKLRGYTFVYDGPSSTSDQLKQRSIATVSLWSDSQALSSLEPSVDSYVNNAGGQGQTTSEPGLYYNLKEDVYIILKNFADNSGQTASFEIKHNPMVIWFWIGAVVMSLGGLMILLAVYLPGTVLVGSDHVETKKFNRPEAVTLSRFSCPKCGARYGKGQKHCTECGATLPSDQAGKNVCSNCGAPKKENSKFCIDCGSKFS